MAIDLGTLELWHLLGILVLAIGAGGYFYGRILWNIRTNEQMSKKAHSRIDELSRKMDSETNGLSSELKEMRKDFETKFDLIINKINDINSRLVRLETVVLNGHKIKE